MPNIKSAKKRVRTSENKANQNKIVKSHLKTTAKKFNASVEEGNKSEATKKYTDAIKAVDKAVSKNLLDKNNGSHKKSKYTKILNKMN